MKYILSLLLVFSFNLSFSQMTLSEMMRVYYLDFDQFETYAIGNGYEFYSTKNNDDVNGVSYTKGYSKDTKYLSLYSTFYKQGKMITYQTSNSTEFLYFKTQMKNLGFKLYSSETVKGYPNKVYRNNIWEVSMYTSEVGYELNLRKF